jgi:Ca2+:H+ antiporter
VDSLLKELRYNRMLWLLVLVPVALVAAKLAPTAHTLLFVLSVLAIVPLAALLSHATESVAEKTGDAAGGLLNATLGNLTELVIAAAALRVGEYALVKGSIAGAIVTNTLFMLGASFLLGGLKHHVQEYNRAIARLDAGLLFLAAIALVSPSAIAKADLVPGAGLTQKLSVALAVLLIVGYGLGLLFSLKTHREIFASAEHVEASEPPWPIGVGPDHAGRGHGTCGAGERDFCRVGAEGGRDIRDEPSVRRFHRCGTGRRCRRNGRGVFRRSQGPSRSERGDRAGERIPDRAVRRPCACTA